MTNATHQIAYCRLVFQNDHWLPIGLNTQLSATHRSKADAPIIYAEFMADVADGQFAGWRSANFTAYEVRADGSVDFRLDEMVLTLESFSSDHEVEPADVVDIRRLRAARRREADERWVPHRLRIAAIDRAAVQIKDRLNGVKTMGVTLIDHEQE